MNLLVDFWSTKLSKNDQVTININVLVVLPSVHIPSIVF